MAKVRSLLPEAVSALVSAGVVDASRRDDAQRVLTEVLGVPREKRVSSRTLLVEIGAYVGGALVVASIGLFLAQYWAELTGPVQVTVLAAIASVLAVAGLAVSGLGPRSGDLRGGNDQVRRRLTSALLSAAAATAGISVGRLIGLQVSEGAGSEGWPIVAGALTALVLAAAAYVHAPSVVGQLTMTVAIFMGVTAGWSLLDVEQTETLWPGAAFMAIGILWLVGAENRLFREVVQAQAIGAAMALFGAQFTLFGGGHDNLSHLLMVVVSAAAFLMYVLKVAWPYLVIGVLGVTLVVPEAIIDWSGGSLGPAGAVLVAGVTLLVASIAGLRVRRGVTEEQQGR